MLPFPSLLCGTFFVEHFLQTGTFHGGNLKDCEHVKKEPIISPCPLAFNWIMFNMLVKGIVPFPPITNEYHAFVVGFVSMGCPFLVRGAELVGFNCAFLQYIVITV